MKHTLFFILIFVGMAAPAVAQLGASPSPGDFRVNDGSGTAPSVGLHGRPSVPTGPPVFRDPTGAKSPSETLRQLDKQLGAGAIESPLSSPGGRTFEIPGDLRGNSAAGSHPSSENVFK